MLDNSVWESTREGVHRQLSEAATKADMERRRADESARRCQDLEAQSDSLTQRIIELEQALAAGTVHRGSSVSGVDTDRDIREYASRVQELQSRLQVAECQTRIDISTMRQQLRRNSAMLALAKTEAAECRMMADAYKLVVLL